MAAPSVFARDLPQKLAAFCLLFGQYKDLVKRQVLSGISIELALDNMYLMVTADLCRLLIGVNDVINFQGGDEGDVTEDSQEDEDSEDDDDESDIDPLEEMAMVEAKNSGLAGYHHQEAAGFVVSKAQQRRPFPCDYPQCQFRGASSRGLSFHQKSHYDGEKFRCIWTGCQETSAYRNSIIRHVERSHLNHQGASSEESRRQAAQYAAEADNQSGKQMPATSNGMTLQQSQKRSSTSQSSLPPAKKLKNSNSSDPSEESDATTVKLDSATMESDALTVSTKCSSSDSQESTTNDESD